MQVDEKSVTNKMIDCCKNSRTDNLIRSDIMTKESDAIKPELEVALNVIAKKEGFTYYRIQVNNFSSDCNNMLSSLVEVNIKGTTQHGNKEIDLFVKSIISGQDTNEVMELEQLFGNEAYLYNELTKIFNDLQDEAKIPPNERYSFVKCYMESNTEFTIMEDMRKKGFQVGCRSEIPTLEFAETCFRQLAKFHALSFVLQDKQPDYFNKYIRTLKFPIDFGEEWENYILKQCNLCMEYLDDNAKSKFEKFIPNASKKLLKYFLPSSIQSLCHGDYKPNNILKRANEGEIEVIPVDYQLLHYGCPVMDFHFFIFTATDREFRRNHLNYLKDLYHDTMRNFMKKFNVSIEDYCPREKYDQYFRDTLDGGLSIGVWMIHIALGDVIDKSELVNTKLSEFDFVKNDLVKVRFQEIVDDFIEWGYL